MSQAGVADGRSGGLRIPHGRRLFATLTEEPRARRVTDVLVVVAGTVAAVVVSLVGVPAAGADRRVGDWLSAPFSLDVVRDASIACFSAWALALVVTAAVRRRFMLVRDLVVAAVLVVGLAVLASVLAHGGWVGALFGRSGSGGWLEVWTPPLALAVPAAAVFAASPQLSKPARRFGHWLLVLAAVGLALGGRLPTAIVSAWLVAIMAAAVVHLAFGSSRGRPSLADVQLALERSASRRQRSVRRTARPTASSW